MAKKSGELDTMTLRTNVVQTPLKIEGEAIITQEQLGAQAGYVLDCLEPVDYSADYSTCGDERERVGLLNGQPIVEARPSVYGGSNVFALYLAEMSGFFGADDTTSGEARLASVTKVLNENGIKSGGHKNCAANALFNALLTHIADPANRYALIDYSRQELGAEFDKSASEEAFGFADKAVKSGRYADWDESVLERVLGDEAGQAIEILVDKPHEGKSVVKLKTNGQTVSQTRLHHMSGNDSFIIDDAYKEAIVNAMASGPEAARMAVVMRHVAEILNAGVYAALPNTELHQINVTA